MNKLSYKITSTNKRERTVTITRYLNSKPYDRRRSARLDKEEFNYYSRYATESDIKNLLYNEDFIKL